MYKKSLQTDYIWIKVRATETISGPVKFVISSIYLKKDYYEELLTSHDREEVLNTLFPYDLYFGEILKAIDYQYLTIRIISLQRTDSELIIKSQKIKIF